MEMILVGVLSSSVLVAIINALSARWMWKANKKAKEEEKNDDILKRLEAIEQCRNDMSDDMKKISERLEYAVSEQGKLLHSIKHSNQLLMRDRIKSLAQEKLKNETITFEDRKLLHDMWDSYHNDWDGNGDLNLIMEAIDELQLEVK